MKLHCIAYPNRDQEHATAQLLEHACSKAGISFALHNPDTFDYTAPENIPDAGDAVYRIAVDQWPLHAGRSVEQWLLSNDVVSFYENPRTPHIYNVNPYLMLKRNGIPIPATIPHITKRKKQLNRYVEALGGLPIIVKVPGSSRGKGVMKVSDIQTLYSIADYLYANGQHAVMRQYIPTTSSARLVVVGDRVVASMEFSAGDGDFRSNAGNGKVTVHKQYAQEVQDLAVLATQANGVRFGGVDILFDKKNNPYVIEVNFPCKFIRTNRITGSNVAEHMIDYLTHRSRQITTTIHGQATWHDHARI